MNRFLRPCSALLMALALHGLSAVEDPASATLPLRAALHEDATLEAPLTQLVEAWRQAQRLPELLALYRAHLGQYPQDSGATIVLLRLLQATRDPAAATAARQAVTDFPDSAYLRWLAFLALNDARDPAALDALAKAVELETVAWRRDQWTERLLGEAVKRGRSELVEKYLTAAATQEASATGKLAIGRRQALAGLHVAALATFDAAMNAAPAPEVLVELQVESANSEAALKRPADAAQRLDALLQRLGSDHWRRAEITRRRLELAGGENERAAMIAAARARMDANVGDDAAALDLARLLLAADRRRDALATLTTATTGDRGGARVEQELFALHERLHDPVALDAWLSQRLAAQPTRTDLSLRRVRTLIDLGKADEATALRQRVIKELRADERNERLLTLARDLRRDSRHAEAAQVLEELLAAEPQRIDLTRELSEAWLAAGNRGRVEELLGRDLPPTAAPEQVLDLVQFLIGAKQYLAASRAINARLTLDSGFFELRVQAIRLAGRTGDVRGAQEAAQKARALTDTAARYRLWLEAAVEAAGEERDAAWLEKEFETLGAAGQTWDATRLERLLAFAEICVARDRVNPAIALIDEALVDPNFPLERRAELRRQLVALLERTKDQVERLPDQLAQLAKEDPTMAMECRARAALLDYNPASALSAAAQRNTGEAARNLSEINVDQLSDPALVARIETVLNEAGNAPAALACLKRLTVLEPATASHWERWLTALGGSGDEKLLREAIRRLLAGIDNLELSTEIRDQLTERLADSCWRSAAVQAARNDAPGWQAVLALLDEAGTTSVRADTGWILAGRVLALHHLARHQARDQALAELDAEPKLSLVFPDGLGTSRAALHALIKQPTEVTSAPVTRALPPAPWAIAWSATFPKAVHGTWIDRQQVVVALADGALIGLDRLSGARVWQRPGTPRASGPVVVNPYTGTAAQPRETLLRPAVVAGRVVVATGKEVSAYAIADGALVWRCNLIHADGVLANDHQLLAWSDKDGRAVGLDPADGRLLWSSELPTLKNEQFQGASQTISGEHGVLLGKHAAVIDLRTGSIRWAFSDAEVVDAKVALTKVAVVPMTPLMHMGSRGYRQFSGFAGGPYAQPAAIDGPTSWTTTFISRARQPMASVVAFGSDLLIGDPSSSAVIPLALPLRSTALPVGTVLGTYGRRALLLTNSGAQICSLDDGSVISQIPLTSVLRKAEEGLTANPANAWISGVVSGRLGWLSGPGGVLTIDLDRSEIVDQQTWDAQWSVAADDVMHWTLGGAVIGNQQMNNIYGHTNNSVKERLPVGVVSAGFAVLPVGSQRLVALSGARDGH